MDIRLVKKHSQLLAVPSLLLALAFLSACGASGQTEGANTAQATPAATSAAGQESFTDPFSYCAAVETIDTPDARYTGESMPAVVGDGLQSALGLTGTPAPPITENSVWRCMDGKVYACTVGANLPCLEKANTDRTPTEGMIDFCKEEPDADFIPMAVTGHDTVYDWSCKEGTPEAGDQVAQVDAQGFIADIWYEIAAP